MIEDYAQAVRKAIDIQRGAMNEILLSQRGQVPDEVQRARYEHFKSNPDAAYQLAARHVPEAQVPQEAARYMQVMERRYDRGK